MRPNTEVDNSLRDLPNSSHHKKDEFNKCFIIHSKYCKVLNMLTSSLRRISREFEPIRNGKIF